MNRRNVLIITIAVLWSLNPAMSVVDAIAASTTVKQAPPHKRSGQHSRPVRRRAPDVRHMPFSNYCCPRP